VRALAADRAGVRALCDAACSDTGALEAGVLARSVELAGVPSLRRQGPVQDSQERPRLTLVGQRPSGELGIQRQAAGGVTPDKARIAAEMRAQS